MIKEFYKLTTKNFILYISGFGEKQYVNYLKKMIAQKKMNDKIKFIGYVSENVLKKYYIACDTYISCSISEAGPFSTYLALYYEKPIITTNSVGCREVIEAGKNGLVVPVKDPVALASAMERLVDDEELRIKMGKYGRKKVLREFDERIIVGQTLKLYEELLKGKSQR